MHDELAELAPSSRRLAHRIYGEERPAIEAQAERDVPGITGYTEATRHMRHKRHNRACDSQADARPPVHTREPQRYAATNEVAMLGECEMRASRNRFLQVVVPICVVVHTSQYEAAAGNLEAQSPLTQSSVGFYQDVAWAPDGTALTVSVLEEADTPDGFQYHVDRLVLDPLRLEALTSGPMDLWTSWAPDGKSIVCSSRDGKASDIFLVRVDGSGRFRLTSDDANDTQPDWSPDGTRIAFVSNRSGKEQVYVMNIDGSEQTRVGAAERDAQNPAWSPDGSQIVYSETDSTGNDEIYLMNVDGTGRRRLTKGVWPHWSPDGSRILFGAPHGLSVVNADGTRESLLVPGAEFGAFSPDGKKIAYIITSNGMVSVNVMNADGSESRRLLTRPAPKW